MLRSFHDFRCEVRQHFGQSPVKLWPLIAAISKELPQKREPTAPSGEPQHAAVAVLNVCRMNNGMEQKTSRIDEEVSFLALDLFARIGAVWIDAGPPFSALFPLWLSITQAVGLASLPSFSRHFT